MESNGPPKDHDISHLFEPVDRRNIGGGGLFNGGVFVVRHRRTGKLVVEKKYKAEEILNGGVSTSSLYTIVETSGGPCFFLSVLFDEADWR